MTCLLAILVNCVIAPNPPPNVCETDICKKVATHLKSYMDETINPCDNFYDFACGTFMKTTILPKSQVADMSFYRVWNQLNKNIDEVLSKESVPNETHANKLSKGFQKTCKDTATLNAAGKQPMLDLLEKYGGWPVLKGENEWKGDNWDWLKVKRQIFEDGFVDDQFDIILAFGIGPDDKDSSKSAVFVSTIDQLGLTKNSMNEILFLHPPRLIFRNSVYKTNFCVRDLRMKRLNLIRVLWWIWLFSLAQRKVLLNVT